MARLRSHWYELHILDDVLLEPAAEQAETELGT
jgi:hypothetical protein